MEQADTVLSPLCPEYYDLGGFLLFTWKSIKSLLAC